MPSERAVSSARCRSREASAAISQNLPFCIPGMTFFTPILAVLRIPHRTLLAISRHDSCKVVSAKQLRPQVTPSLLSFEGSGAQQMPTAGGHDATAREIVRD